jgi:hypothetical protein
LEEARMMMFTHKTIKQYRETAGIAALAVGLAACAGTPPFRRMMRCQPPTSPKP